MVDLDYFTKNETSLINHDYSHTHELNKTFSRFNKIRLEHNYGYRNLLPIREFINKAQNYQQINLNTQTHYNAIMIDMDEEDLLTEWLEAGLPTPTIQTVNKHNNKAHLVWLLTTPVWKQRENTHAVDYYTAIVDSLKELLEGADVNYTSTSTKNFLNTKRYRVTYNDLSYELGDFRSFILPKFNRTKKVKDLDTKGAEFIFDNSRHLFMFEKLRHYGYFYSQDTSLDLIESLTPIADEINSMFESPIKYKHILNSVVNFCEKNRDNFSRKSPNQGIMKFEKIRASSKEEYLAEKKRRQSLSAKRTTDIKRLKTAKKIKLAVDYLTRKKEALTIENVAKFSKLSISTIKRNIRIIGFFTEKNIKFIRYIRVIAKRATTLASMVHTDYISSEKRNDICYYSLRGVFW